MLDSSLQRFHFYFNHVEGRSILTLPKNDWDDLWPNIGSAIKIDVSRTPMSMVAQSASVIASVAVQYATTSPIQIQIYRYDQKDEPTPVNQDKYIVWEDLSKHPDFQMVVSATSTQNSPELQGHLQDNVFIVKLEPGRDHWLPSLPASTLAVMEHI